MTRIIDMRCRPAYLDDFFGATPGSAANETARWLNRRVGTRGDDEHYARSRTPEGFLAEVRDAGLHRAVVVGRHTPRQHLSPQRVHEIVRGHEELLGVAGVDPVGQGRAALDAAEHAVKVLGLSAIGIEPGFGTPPRHADDPLYWPLYELACALGVPVTLMSGPTTPDPRFNDPAPLAVVAAAFPRLDLVVYHGHWPHTQAVVGVAFRWPNVHVVPDMYLFQAGSQVFVEAANTFMADQLLFGSSYPFRPIRQSIDDASRLGFRDDVVDKVMFENAARVLRLR